MPLHTSMKLALLMQFIALGNLLFDYFFYLVNIWICVLLNFCSMRISMKNECVSRTVETRHNRGLIKGTIQSTVGEK